ncbi:MAG: hypothetical protein JWM68_3694 [Verrucomicrobiales bacterium]|nr:hypothetical protein [Verrucomicrobiales bacterium]
MKAYIPTAKGFIAFVLVIFASIYVPVTFPARSHGRPPSFARVSEGTWIMTIALLTLCVAMCVYAAVKGNCADKFAAVVSFFILVWFTLGFFLVP